MPAPWFSPVDSWPGESHLATPLRTVFLESAEDFLATTSGQPQFHYPKWWALVLASVSGLPDSQPGHHHVVSANGGGPSWRVWGRLNIMLFAIYEVNSTFRGIRASDHPAGSPQWYQLVPSYLDPLLRTSPSPYNAHSFFHKSASYPHAVHLFILPWIHSKIFIQCQLCAKPREP